MQGIAYLQELFPLLKAKESEQSKQEVSDPVLIELSQVTQQLKNIKNRFDFETDYDMIDSCIYEERALLSKYSHLISIARQKGLRCTAVAHYNLTANNTK